MGIYRGPGGTGDAVNDASSEALITIQARDAALAAQAAAEAAQTAAELAETNAETAETNAETAETNAETAATNAASSASAASTSASNAASSASAASTSASNASTSASNAASSASAASTSASNAASSASTASTQATNASNSASAASTSATNASNSASAAATSATNAANSATAAQTAQTAAELAETNAETAETNAETAATNAANSASAASTSATNASNSASAASTSATNASNSASAAATSATNASNSASAASTSASNAATSESNAATSASNAAASYDSFDDRYLGAKSSAPTLDNDGNALLTGALYFNTTTNEMKVWSGSAWLNAYASLSGALLATNNLSDLNNTATARTNLGVAIGTNVQAWDADLDTWATKTAPSGTVVGTSDSQTLTNKTIALGSNTVSGTLAQFNTAVTDADLVSIAGSETLTNKTLTSPTINTATISGGTINNTSIGGTTPAAGSFTSLTDSGNLAFTGTGNRITGDFDGATIANRVQFQTTGTNQGTTITGIPNGTGSVVSWGGYASASDPANTVFGRLRISLTDVRIDSAISGTGTYVPITMYTGGSERLRIDTSGNVLIGNSTDPLGGNRLLVQSAATANNNRTFSVYNTAATSTTAFANRLVQISSFGSGADATLHFSDQVANNAYFGMGSGALYFATNGTTERMRIDSSGRLLLGTTAVTTSSSQSGEIYSTGAVGFMMTNTTAANYPLSVKNEGTSGTRNLINFYEGAAGGTSRANISFDSSNNFAFASTNATTFSTASAERMRIDSSGNVGIGTSSQITRLAVAGNQINFGTNPYIALSNAANTTLTYLQANTTTGQFDILTSGTGSNGFMTFSTGTGVEQMRLTAGGNLQFNSGYGSVATAYGCRAWVNFNGTGTVSIRASGNVSSITDNGAGDYTVNFTNAMPDANYSVSGATRYNTSNSRNNIFFGVYNSSAAFSTGSVRVNACNDGGSLFDCEVVTVEVVR